MSTNNSSHDRKRSATEADFKANGLQQCKVHLARKGISQLEIGMAGNTIPDISDVIRNARWLTETHETKLGACLFQISFLVTIGSKLLVVDRPVWQSIFRSTRAISLHRSFPRKITFSAPE